MKKTVTNNQRFSHQKDSRQQNMSLLLHDLWRNGPLSKAMLAQRSGLTKGTVSNICREMSAMGLIREAGQHRTGIGRPGDLIELNPNARCSIGLEISTNYVSAVLSNLCGTPIWKQYTAIEIGSPFEVIQAVVEALALEAIDRARAFNIPLLGIGIGVPGVVNHFVTEPAMGWKEVPLKQILIQRFHLPVLVENKARSAAMAEALHGSAQEASSFIYVSVGTDVWSTVEAAVVNEGYLYRGFGGRAVDAGHTILDPNGPLCRCGQRGCWQAMVNVGREVEMVRQRLEAGEASVLQSHAANGYATLDHRMIHQAAVEGDPLAKDVASKVLMNHAQGISNLVLLFDPELVVIGWETMVLPAEFTARMHTMDNMPEFDISSAVKKHVRQSGKEPPKIVHASLDPEVVMIGAAAMLAAEFMRTPPTEPEPAQIYPDPSSD